MTELEPEALRGIQTNVVSETDSYTVQFPVGVRVDLARVDFLSGDPEAGQSPDGKFFSALTYLGMSVGGEEIGTSSEKIEGDTVELQGKLRAAYQSGSPRELVTRVAENVQQRKLQELGDLRTGLGGKITERVTSVRNSAALMSGFVACSLTTTLFSLIDGHKSLVILACVADLGGITRMAHYFSRNERARIHSITARELNRIQERAAKKGVLDLILADSTKITFGPETPYDQDETDSDPVLDPATE